VTDYEFSSDISVELIQHMGNDLSVVMAARVSTLGADAGAQASDDRGNGLINFLMRDRHGSPFEHNAMTFRVTAPIFVWREHHRHRIGWSYNEESGRYKQLDPKFYVPDEHRNLVQKGKTGHYQFVPGDSVQFTMLESGLRNSGADAYRTYEHLLDRGIAREVARMCLPVNIYSTCYTTCNARSLLAFLSLRTKDEASTFPSFPQREIEMVAEQYEAIFADLFPVTHASFVANGRVAP
jgi:thymidylate synthase (FAD)